MKKLLVILMVLLTVAFAYGQSAVPPWARTTVTNVASIKTTTAADTLKSDYILDSLTSVYTATITDIPATIQTVREADSTQLAANTASLTQTNASLWSPPLATNYLEVAVNFVAADSVWSSEGTHEVINVTGIVEFWLVVEVTGSAEGTDSLGVQFGSTVLQKAAKVDWDSGDVITFGSTAAYRVVDPTAYSDGSLAVYHGFSNSVDIGYFVGTGTIVNAGGAKFKIWWKNFGTATVVAGAGGTL